MGCLSQNKVKQLFKYVKSTGVLTNRVMRNPRALKGAVAGTKNAGGYLQVKVEGKTYTVQQLAFLYVKGYIPKQIDHKDRVRHNNTWSNLREATSTQNHANRSKNKNSVSKYKGVSKHTHGKWQAQTKVNGKNVHLGCYNTELGAARVYNKFMRELHGEYFAP